MNGVISVIVPVYNVAAYLPQCVESLWTQNYERLEILLVDDGSTDESGAICDALARQDERIRVIHQKNGGAAAAKNTGLRAATGEYLTFLDSDDYLDPGSYGYMVLLMEELDADIVQCAIRDVYLDRTEDCILKPGRKVFTGVEYLESYTRDWSCGLMTDKLFKRKLFDGIFFEEGHKIDDEYFVYQGVMNARKVVSDDRIVYNYRRRASSVMLSPASRKQIAIDRVDYLAKRRVKVVNRFPELREKFDDDFIYQLITLSQKKDSSEESLTLIKTQLKLYMQEKGHTMPSVFLWPALLQLYFSSTEKLLAKCTDEVVIASTSGLFE